MYRFQASWLIPCRLITRGQRRNDPGLNYGAEAVGPLAAFQKHRAVRVSAEPHRVSHGWHGVVRHDREGRACYGTSI